MKKSQTVLEYCILIGIVVTASITARIYLTRILQEKYRQSADVYGGGVQYEKGLTNIITDK